jgi:hypothetical protein
MICCGFLPVRAGALRIGASISKRIMRSASATFSVRRAAPLLYYYMPVQYCPHYFAADMPRAHCQTSERLKFYAQNQKKAHLPVDKTQDLW